MKVHILLTIRDGNEQFATCVFETLRVGFPTADVTVHINRATEAPEHTLAESGAEQLAQQTKCEVRWLKHTIHHEWIASLIRTQQGPFWICDTDVIFYRSVEGWLIPPGTPLFGALIPEFHDEFTNTITRSRLHTSLLWIDPSELKEESQAWLSKHPNTPFNPAINLVFPVMVPLNGKTYFYDTMALAWHAIGGQAFTAANKDDYFHFHFGTLGDVVLPRLTNREAMEKARLDILVNPEKGRGVWRAQEEYFAQRQALEDGADVIAPIERKDAEEAQKWNVALCCNNESAMTFCDLWYNYCHGIDDLIDTLRDGRPRMSKDQMISLFFKAALLYNSDFYIAHRNLLAPIVLLVTNTYRDSVAWENSSKSHLRQMGDVFRTCGNEMFVMVALLCGGEAHMRQMSLAIKERDWLGQHSKEGVPL